MIGVIHIFSSLLHVPTLYIYWILLTYYNCCYCHTCYSIAIVTLVIKIVAITVTATTIICRATEHLLQRDIPGAVELTTQLSRSINILWLPLYRISKLGWNTTRKDYRDPPYLWVWESSSPSSQRHADVSTITSMGAAWVTCRRNASTRRHVERRSQRPGMCRPECSRTHARWGWGPRLVFQLWDQRPSPTLAQQLTPLWV